MSDSTKPSSTTVVAPTGASAQESSSDSKLKITRARSDISSNAEDDNGPSSPHFYSLSVRKSSPSLDSYPADSVNSAADSLEDFNIDDSIKEDLASEQQVHEQAVKLDLLRRQHSQRAKQTLEQLQTAASTASQRSESPGRPSSEPRRSNSGVAMQLVRQQSEQLKQASGDLKRLAEEQRTLAEEAVANFLLKEDMMMRGADSSSAGTSQADAGLSQALNAVFEDTQGSSSTSLTRQLEKIRRAEQAIKDAEADEQIADQLAALQLTLSQLAEQEESGNVSEDATDAGRSQGANDGQTLPPGRHLLKDISENSQEGLDSSHGHSSSSHHSHMASSAFAALSQIDGFQGEDHPDQDAQGQDHPDEANRTEAQADSGISGAQSKLNPAESAQAEQQTAQHEQHQAQSPDKEPKSGAKASQISDNSSPDRQVSAAKASDAQSLPLTEHSLSALKVSTDTSHLSPQAIPSAVPELAQSRTPASPETAGSQGSELAGSTPGSHTFDSELHGNIAALVQAPGNTDTAERQPSGSQIPTDVDDAVLNDSAEGREAIDADSASTPSRHPAEASQEAAAPVYSLGSDDEEDLTIVSSEDQAREAQAATTQFMESSSRPATPDTAADPQDPPQAASLAQPPSESELQQQHQDDSASESAADVSTYATNNYDQDARLADAFEPEEFKGMLFHDGVDSQGRPVIVVNTDAVGTSRKARGQALQYMLHRLEPIVVQGPYVLVMVATGQHQKSNKLPAMWLISAYRNLSRPFRKNVRYILLVRPSGGLKALVACIRPFVSAKAAKKVRKVDSLAAIAAATSNEVTLQHLGSRFAAAAGSYILEGAETQSAAANPYDMPQF